MTTEAAVAPSDEQWSELMLRLSRLRDSYAAYSRLEREIAALLDEPPDSPRLGEFLALKQNVEQEIDEARRRFDCYASEFGYP